MSVTTKFPTTYEELAEIENGQRYFPATWEEYLDLLETAEFSVEFDENRIITMSTASDNHEALVIRLGHLFAVLFDDSPDFHLRGSNRPVHIADKKVYNPDLHITKEQPQIMEYRKGLTANTNPWLIVEILSPSTESFDWTTKLPSYKKIPSVKYILYVQQNAPFISVYKRSGQGNIWENEDFDRLDQSFQIAGKSLLLKDVYRKVLS